MKPTLILAIPLLLSACGGYPSLEDCEAATGGQCHIATFWDGKAHPGPGINVDSPAGAAILSNALSNSYQPVHPYILPPPVNYNAYSPTVTCSTLGSELTHTITCN